MRVIAGTCKGRKLAAPKSKDVRPVLDQVKEAIFNILFDVEGCNVLDLFAGSGSVGIEALSRGADHATFVERDAEACRIIRSNLKACDLESSSTVMKMQASAAVDRLSKSGAAFDLIFVDPPYLKDYVNDTLMRVAASAIAMEGSTLVIEHHPKEPIGDIPGLTLTDTRNYGQTLISFMTKQAKG
jgi:16S rRNA (guanine966-N2)-methyltransferase